MKNIIEDEIIIFGYLSAYLYNLETNSFLIERLEKATFHSDEANTDREFKIAVKQAIINNQIKITEKYCNIYKNNQLYYIPLEEIINSKYIEIKNVYLPDELTDKHKETLKKNNSIYTNPDLLLEININGKTKFESIELKSTNKDEIPGSSIQQINPDELTIFIKKTNNRINITTGLYINSIKGSSQFPDRSPRPQVKFSELSNWNLYNRKISENTLNINIDYQEYEDKKDILNDWRYKLSKDWLRYIKTKEFPTKWFNNSLRMFVVDLLEEYNTLSEEEKLQLIEINKNYQNDK